MSQSGYTPILIYGSGTASNVPLAANLTSGSSGAELALNYADGKLFYKDSGGVVQVLATKGTGPIGGSNTQIQFNNSGVLGGSASLTWDGTYLTAGSIKDSALTSGRVTYAGASGLLQDSANLTFDGTTLTANALTTTSTVTINGGTANGVAYLNGSKVLTTGSALTFDGTNLATTGSVILNNAQYYYGKTSGGANVRLLGINSGDTAYVGAIDSGPTSTIFNSSSTSTFAAFYASGSEQMRLNSTGLGIGTSSPGTKLDVNGTARIRAGNTFYFQNAAADANATISASGGSGSSDMAINASGGNLGIGTSSPSYKLDTNSSSAGTIARFVNGVGRGYVRMDGYDDMTLQFYRRGAATGFIQTDSSGAEFIAGTAGAYPFSFYTNNTERMRISSSGNLGIGTSSPSVRLDVQGGSINTSSFVTITPTTGTSNAIYRATNTGGTFYAGLDNSAGGVTGTAYSGLLWHTGAYPIAFGTSGTERMRLDSSGNLGIGVTPSAWYTPDYKAFQLTGGGALYNNGANNFVALSQNMFVNGSLANTYIATAAASRYRQSAGTHIWDIAPSGTAGNAITFTQAMTLDASGNLGVGTTSPSYKLDISGAAAALRLNGGANTYADITDGTNTLRIQINGGDANISSTGAYPIVFNTNGSERARIDSSGNLLVGTTSTYGGPGRINIGFNQSSNFGITLRNTSATATGVFVSFENSGGTGNGSISQTNSTTVAYNTSSDRRLKKAIVPAPSAGSDIDAIEVVSHEWVSNNDVVKYGVVAQDLHKIAPLAVTVGDESDEIERVWGVDYSKLVPMLVKEIQELRARVSQLENK